MSSDLDYELSCNDLMEAMKQDVLRLANIETLPLTQKRKLIAEHLLKQMYSRREIAYYLSIYHRS